MMMNADPLAALSPLSPAIRAEWSCEVFAVAEALRKSNRHRRLRDVTISLPVDHAAVEAIELACLVLAQGDLCEAASELDRFLDRVAEDGLAAERFLISIRSVARRVGPIASHR